MPLSRRPAGCPRKRGRCRTSGSPSGSSRRPPPASRTSSPPMRRQEGPRRLALDRFLTAPGDYRDMLLTESTAAALEDKFSAAIRPRSAERLSNSPTATETG